MRAGREGLWLQVSSLWSFQVQMLNVVEFRREIGIKDRALGLMRTEAMGMSEFAHLEWRDERKGNQKGSSRILKEKLSHGDQTEGASGHQYQMSPPARTSLKSTGKEMSIMCHNWGVISHFEGNGEEKELGFAGWGLNRNWSK